MSSHFRSKTVSQEETFHPIRVSLFSARVRFRAPALGGKSRRQPCVLPPFSSSSQALCLRQESLVGSGEGGALPSLPGCAPHLTRASVSIGGCTLGWTHPCGVPARIPPPCRTWYSGDGPGSGSLSQVLGWVDPQLQVVKLPELQPLQPQQDARSTGMPLLAQPTFPQDGGTFLGLLL